MMYFNGLLTCNNDPTLFFVFKHVLIYCLFIYICPQPFHIGSSTDSTLLWGLIKSEKLRQWERTLRVCCFLKEVKHVSLKTYKGWGFFLLFSPAKTARHFHWNHVSLTFTSYNIMKATNEEGINISVTFIFFPLYAQTII